MPSDNFLTPIIFLYLPVMGIFYFLVFRPQKEKQKQHEKMLAELKKNDEIVTNSGIHGTVVSTKDTTVLIRVDEHARLEIDRSAVATITNKAK